MHDQPIIIKKKKAHGHKHHGGSWKVAYADFVTAMMAFFMVLWILGMSDDDKKVIASYFQDPIGFEKHQVGSKVRLQDFKGEPVSMIKGTSSRQGTDRQDDEKRMRKVQGDIMNALNAESELSSLLKQVEVTITSEGLRIELVEQKHSTFFQSGSATLSAAGVQLVRDLAKVLAQSKRSLSIEGHTDAVPYVGKGYTNWDLSQDRAASVRRALVANGVSERQLIGVHGYADKYLRDPEHPNSEVNRRVSILLPFQQGAAPPADHARNEFHDSLPKPDLSF
jgi:chemotaxis protein MotB